MKSIRLTADDHGLSIARILFDRDFGTGSLPAKRGAGVPMFNGVLTCAHVVGEEGNGVTAYRDDEEIGGKVLVSDEDTDLAWVVFPVQFVPYFDPFPVPEHLVHPKDHLDWLDAAWAPGEKVHIHRPGALSDTVKLGAGGGYPFVLIDHPHSRIVSGDSGSPIFKDDKVFGLVAGTVLDDPTAKEFLGSTPIALAHFMELVEEKRRS